MERKRQRTDESVNSAFVVGACVFTVRVYQILVGYII